jgi:hypothetical protein
VDALQAETVLAGGSAELVAVAREAQDDPDVAVHDAQPVQAGRRPAARDRRLTTLGPRTAPDQVQVTSSG